MKKILVAALALSLAGPALAAEASQIFATKCAVCHGKDGTGSPIGKKLGAPNLKTVKDSEKEIAEVITNGKGKMSAFKGKLSPEEIQSVAKYVKGGLK